MTVVNLRVVVVFSSSSAVQLEAMLGVSISQVGVDDCPYTDCGQFGGCSSELSFSQLPVALSSGNTSLVSLSASSTAQCGCRGREAIRLPCSAYPFNPCLNRGTCQDGPLGYRQVQKEIRKHFTFTLYVLNIRSTKRHS